MNILSIVADSILQYKRLRRKLVAVIFRNLFEECGEKVIFDPLSSHFSYKNIRFGSNVFVAPGAHFSNTHGKIVIGSNVIIGPNVTLLGGDHDYQLVGSLMFGNKKSCSHIDPNIIIHDDVWIGANVTILKGVVIGKGAIIGAASVVTKDVDVYTVVVGNPARKLKDRFSDVEIARHEEIIRNMHE